MKKTILHLIFIVTPLLTYTQEVIWEINANAGISSLPIQNDPPDYEFLVGAELEPNYEFTYNVGGSVGLQIIPKLYVHTGLNFMHLKSSEKAVNSFDIGEDIIYNLNYNTYFFSAPVYLKFKHKQFGIYAGGLGLFYLKGDTDYEIFFGEETFTSEDDNTWNNNLELKDLSFGFLAGLSLDFTSTIGMRIEWHQGLSNVAKSEDSIFVAVENYSRHTQYFTFGLVYYCN